MTHERDATGIAGLDDILLGGLPHGHLYLLEGEPGTGKTTVAMDFLRAGLAKGEKTLYVTLSETEDELRLVASSHNWNVDGIEMLELQRDVAQYSIDDQYTVFEPTEVELGGTVGQIYDAVNRLQPRRVVLDSLSELRLLSRDSLRFRREVLSFKRFFADRDATVLMLDDRTMDLHEGLLQSLAHGVLRLERLTTEYGAERRRLTVSKLRGSRFREGYHDYRVNTGGVDVYPRLVASEHRNAVFPGELLSGIANLDHLLGGGLDRGTSTMLLGPSGAGKSTISAMYASAAAEKGEHVEIYLYDENLGTYLARDLGLRLGLAAHIESGTVTVRQIDPAEMSPGEFAAMLREGIDSRGTRHIVIDSLNGLIQAMPGEQTLMIQVHELLSYLNQSSVTTMVTLAQHGMMGNGLASAADLSYVADTLIVLRYFEAFGEVRKAISVVKKRTGDHERTLRELQIVPGGLKVGDPLRQFQGIFTGVPQTFDGEVSLFDGPGR
ncbi:circadian clock protein KaiC [bacterium]|nr:MAG: circadian clock protein KaiC [bacterium]